MTFFTLFVVLPLEDVCTLRHLTSDITVTDIKSKLEISAGLPSQTFKLHSKNYQVLEDDQVLEFGRNVWDGFLLRAQLKESWIPVYEAVARRNLEWLLREEQANFQTSFGLNNEDKRETTVTREERECVALYLASWAGSMRLCQGLLTAGANPDGATPHNRTPLFAASARNNDHIVDILLAHGASLSPKDCNGNTPIDIARRNLARQCVIRIQSFQRMMIEQTRTQRTSTRGEVNARFSQAVDKFSLGLGTTSYANTSRDRPFTATERPKTNKSVRVATKTDLTFGRRSVAFDLECYEEPHKANCRTLPAERSLHPAFDFKRMTSTSVGLLSGIPNSYQHARTPKVSNCITSRVAMSLPNSARDRRFNNTQLTDACNEKMANSEFLRVKSALRNEKPSKEPYQSYIAPILVPSTDNGDIFAKNPDLLPDLGNKVQNFSVICSVNNSKDNVSIDKNINLDKNGETIDQDKIGKNVNRYENGDNVNIANNSDNVNIDTNGDNVSINNNTASVSRHNKGDTVSIDNNTASVSRHNKGDTVSIDNNTASDSRHNRSDNVSIDNNTASVSIDNNTVSVSLDNNGYNFNKDNSSDHVDVDKGDDIVTMNVRRVQSASNEKSKRGQKHAKDASVKDVRPMTADNSVYKCKKYNHKPGKFKKTALRQIQLAEHQKRHISANGRKMETFEQWLKKKQEQEDDAASQTGSDDSSRGRGNERNSLSFQAWLKEVLHRPKLQHNPNTENSVNRRKTVTFHTQVEIQIANKDQSSKSVDPHSYMYAYKQFQERHPKLKINQKTEMNVKEAKNLLKEKNQQMLTTAVTFNEWMTHNLEKQRLLRIIQH